MSSRKKFDRNQAGRARKPARPPERPRLAPRWLTAICLAVVACAAIIPYANSFNGELLYDNLLIIGQNPVVTKESNADKIFTSSYWAGQTETNLYRPITILTYHLQYVNMDSRDNPRPYHIGNFILHAINALLVFAVLLRVARAAAKFSDDRLNALMAAFGGALFAAHPITTEGVTNIVGRADLLAMLFLLCGLWLHMRGGRKSGGGALFFYIVAGLCLGVGMLSKESAIAMVGAAAAYDLLFVWPQRPAGQSFLKWALGRLAACYWIYILVLGGWFAARALVVENAVSGPPDYVDNPLPYMPFLQREAMAIVVLGLYLWRMFWPVTLSADYSPKQIPDVTSAGDLRLLASVGALALIGLAVVLLWKRSRMAAFFILFFFIAVFPVSNIALIIGTIAGERLLYLPSLGWAGVLAVGASYLVSLMGRQWNIRAVGLPCALVAIVAGLYGWRTFERNNDWRDEKTFWAATYKTSPRSVRTLQGYAEALQRHEGDLQEARRCLEKALSIAPEHLTIYRSLAGVYGDLAQKAFNNNNIAESEAYLDKAYDVVQRGAELDRAHQEEIRRRIQAQGRDPGAFLLGDVELNVMIARVAWNRHVLMNAKHEPAKAEEALAEARASLRIAVLGNVFPPLYNVRYAEVLIKMAFTRQGRERTDLLEDAAVSACRAIFFVEWATPEVGQPAWEDLHQCYSMLGYPADSLITSFKGDTKGVNFEIKKRALRSVVLMVRANNVSEEMEKILLLADQYHVPRAALRSALTEPASFDNPRLLTGRE